MPLFAFLASIQSGWQGQAVRVSFRCLILGLYIQMYTSTQVADISTLMARATSRVGSEPDNTLLVLILAKEAEILSADTRKRSWFGAQDEATNHGLYVTQAFAEVLQKLIDAHSTVALLNRRPCTDSSH